MSISLKKKKVYVKNNFMTTKPANYCHRNDFSCVPAPHGSFVCFVLLCFFTIMIVVVNVVAETDTRGAS